MTVLFEDQFDGQAVDPAKWGMYDGPGHAGHGLRKPRAFSVAGGVVTCTGRMEAVGGVPTIVSGGMSARKDGAKFSFLYGRVEAMVRTDPDPAGVMSGVLLTWPLTGSNLTYGENDYYETGHAANSRNPFSTFIHKPGAASGSEQVYFKHPVDGAQWHAMAMEWRADRIAIFRDGAEVWRTTDRAYIPTTRMVPTVQLDAMVAGVALQGPVRLQVDYLRVLS